MLFQQTNSALPFKQWCWQDKENKKLLWFTALAMVVSFSWIKILYPFPNFIPPDSYSYLEAAYNNDFIGIWAIGYSKFLRLVSSFSNSDLVLVIIQYLLLQGSLMYFLFTIRYLLLPGKWLFRIMLAASVLNPLLPHVANFVSSDCLFTALSLIWFTQLLWIIYRQTATLLVIHALVILLAFTIRYNALYYPVISIALLIFNNMPKRAKRLGIVSIVILLSVFIGSTQTEYSIKTGTVQYSAFGGWLMAANALYGYAHATSQNPSTVPLRFRELHSIVNHHMDSIKNLPVRPDQEIGVYYMWDFKSPLRVYMESHIENKQASFLKRWSSMAPLYAAYGRYLIAKHPWLYIQYYAWPNFQRYYVPPTLFMGVYNWGNETVDPIAMKWFGWKDNTVPTYSRDKKIVVTEYFSILLAIINLIYVLGFITLISIPALYKKCADYSRSILWLMLTFWVSNMCFSVLSAPIELRYQIFPLVITFTFGILLIAFIIENGWSIATQSSEETQPATAL
jgi:hypothetical protein